MKTNKNTSLKPGDKVGIVSTARKISREEIEPAIQLLKSWQLVPILGKTIGLVHRQFAGTDKQRAADLQAMIDAQEIKAIICARGGYGTVRILEKVDFSPLANQPKWLAGYSDVTALHNLFHAKLNLPSIHSTMPINFKTNTEAALVSLENALFGNPNDYEISPHSFNKNGVVEAPVVGGNLSILYSLSGTKYDIDTAGKILFLEDLDEYLYHIDRMMMNLKLSGKLENMAGLIVGAMSDMNDNEIPFGKTAEEIIKEQVDHLNIPVCFGFPAGHIEDNRAIILGKMAKLEVGGEHTKFTQN